MEPLELDTAIEELETKVERLRSLYEQYFMGIEKIPPAVVHKDVERRIYLLRREQIRNTAKRFKLQTTIQRYNTFQQYWQRILREIENGTYKRHVLRAERSTAKVGTATPETPLVDPAQVEAVPDSENVAAARARKSIAPSAPRHSIPSNPRQSSLPPAEKVEAFTRALERDLAAALDGDLDFGRMSSKIDDGFDLDGAPQRPNEIPGPLTAKSTQEKPRPRPVGLLPDLRKLPPKPASKMDNPPVAPAQVAVPRPEEQNAKKTVTAISAERLKQLHKDLTEAKLKTAEADQISLNALSRKLETAAKNLSEKHVGKRIDFTVVIKDGKAIVKPIIK